VLTNDQESFHDDDAINLGDVRERSKRAA